jgi:adenylate cyclase
MEAAKYLTRLNIEDNNVGRRLTEEAISICPENPVGYAQLSSVYLHDYIFRNTKSPRETLEKGIELAQKAIAIDESLPWPHELLCFLYSHIREYDKAIAEGERAVVLDPSGSDSHRGYGSALLFVGRPNEAIPMFQKAIRLNPNAHPVTFVNFGYALMNAGRFEEAVSELKKGVQRAPDFSIAHICLAATYSMMGREEEARAEAEEVLRISPKFSVDSWAKRTALKDQSEINKIADALRKAGLK